MSNTDTLDGFFDEVEPTAAQTVTAQEPSQAPVEPLDGNFEDTQPNTPETQDTGSKEDTVALNVPETPESTPTDVDYKAVYARIFENPIKANGKDITIKNVDEAIRLMQMGTDYNRKMGAIKADRALITALKNSGLDSQEKINQMIDIMNGTPEAIQKLVADKGITEQLAEIDEDDDKVKNYKPNNHVPAAKTIALQDTLDEIQSTTDGVNFVSSVLANFDEDSRAYMADNPQVLSRLHSDKVSGNYDIIMDELDRLNSVADPSIAGMNMLNAYATVGNRFAQASTNNHVQQSTTDSQRNNNNSMYQRDIEEQRRQVTATGGRPTSTNRYGATTVDKFVKLLDVDFDELDDKKSAQINSTISQFLGASNGRL